MKTLFVIILSVLGTLAFMSLVLRCFPPTEAEGDGQNEGIKQKRRKDNQKKRWRAVERKNELDTHLAQSAMRHYFKINQCKAIF